MKRFSLVICAVLLLGCSQNKEKVKEILAADGYTNISVGGAPLMSSCSESDSYANSFTAEKNGTSIEGVVCAGAFKSNTIRIDKISAKNVAPAVHTADSIIAARRQALIDSISNGTFKR